MVLEQEGNGSKDLRLLGSMRYNFVMLYNIYFCGVSCCLPKTVTQLASEATATSEHPQWPSRADLTSALMQETYIYPAMYVHIDYHGQFGGP